MHKIATTIIALTIAIIALTTNTHPQHYKAPQTPITSATVVIPTDPDTGVSDTFLDSLRDAGYRGVAGDGVEGIHVPSVVATGLCLTDTDCAYASGEARVTVGAVSDL